ncbi:MAG: peptidoglycan DD-metalloendopeptidase family protein [Thiotrichaceae bacterium]
MMRQLCFNLVLLWFSLNPVFAVESPSLEQIEQKINELQTQMRSNRTEYDRLQNSLEVNEESIGKLSERLEILNEALTDKQQTLTDLNQKRQQQYAQLASQQRILAQQIRSAYVIGRQDYLKLWLNQENPAAIGRVLTYYEYVNKSRIHQIQQISEILQNIQHLEYDINQENSELNQLVAEQTQEKRNLELSRGERQKILDELAQTLESQRKQLAQLQEDKQHLQSLLGNLSEMAKTMPKIKSKPFSLLRGELQPPVTANMTHQFGDERIGHLKWQGITFNANEGQKIQSIAAGRVAFAQWFRNLGLLVIVDHGEGYMSLYAHNQSLYVKTGDWVEMGTTIASVGSSGGQKEAGLYFEIRYQGSPVNPLKWINKI